MIRNLLNSVFIFFVCSFNGQSVFALTSAAINKSAADFIILANKQKSAVEFVQALHGKVPDGIYEFLKIKAEEYKNMPMPQMVWKNSKLILTIASVEVNLEMPAGRKQMVIINHKSLDLFQSSSAQIAWDQIQKALPNFNPKSSKFDWLIAPVYAADTTATRLTGGTNVLAVGATAAVTFLPKQVGIPIAIGLLAFSYYTWKIGTCEEVHLQCDSCQLQEKQLNASFKKEKERAKAFSLKSQRPICPTAEEDPVVEPALEAETVKKLSELIRSLEEKTSSLAVCGDDRRLKLDLCLTNLSQKAYYLCMDALKITDKYIQPLLRKSDGQVKEPAVIGSGHKQ